MIKLNINVFLYIFILFNYIGDFKDLFILYIYNYIGCNDNYQVDVYIVDFIFLG